MTLKQWGRWLPLTLLILLFGLFFYCKLYHYLTFTALAQHRAALLHWAGQHYWLMVLSYSLLYQLAVASSIPGAVFLTLLGGFLFGIPLGTLYVVLSATLGATWLFIAVNTAVGDWLTKQAITGWVTSMQQGFKRHAFNYLLMLRLIPLFPFWIVNIVPAILEIPITTFILATFIGIMPGSLVYVSLGNSLGQLLDAGKTPDLHSILAPKIILPLLGLAFLSLMPVLYQHWQQRRQHIT